MLSAEVVCSRNRSDKPRVEVSPLLNNRQAWAECRWPRARVNSSWHIMTQLAKLTSMSVAGRSATALSDGALKVSQVPP